MNKISLALTIFALITLSGCAEKKESAEAAEMKRQFLASAVSVARQLAEANPKHDSQYYLDKITQAIEVCASEADLSACLQPKLQALRYN